MKHNYLILALAVVLLSMPAYGFGQSYTFNYTGSPQLFVVPQGCNTSVHVDAYGAQGGGNAVSPGGLGGRVQADIPVVPGESLYVYVGGTGDVTGTAGYNGGGTGIGGNAQNPGSGGGGASDVRKGGTTLNDRWVVAGAGGGGMENGGAATGGAGGGLIGGNGAAGGNPWGCTPLMLPTGGTQSTGGLGGTSTSCAWNGFNGTFGQGGNSYNNYRSAGGGGGWYGGGGAHNGTSGAGGSSYAHPSATNVTHTQGVWTGNGQVTLTLVTSVTVTLGPDTTLCGGTVLDAGNPGYSYLWSTGATTQTITVGTSGLYSVVVSDSLGCTGRDSVLLNISAPPIVALGADTAVCDTVTLDAGNPGSSYLWSSGDTSQTVSVGAGTFAVTVTNTAGCIGADTIVVSLVAPPTVNLGGTASGCDSVLLDAGNPGNAYLWSTGATTQTVLVSNSGSYSVTVTQPSGCQYAVSDTVLVTVHPSPSVSILGLDSSYCTTDLSDTLVGNPSGGVFSGTGIIGNEFFPNVAGQGQHTITYVVSDSNGCSATTTGTTLVTICTATADPRPLAITVFPNPSTGRFTIFGLNSGAKVEVYDMLGAKVAGAVATESQITLDLQDSGPGIYIVHVLLDGQWFQRRIVLQ